MPPIPGGHLTPEEIDQVVDKVMEELDFSKDEPLSYADFEHVISKAPDFVNLFRITF